MNNGYKGTKFEWWYFHFISDINFNIIIHPTDMYGLENKSYISVSIFEKDGEGKNFKQSFLLEKTTISDNELYIKNDIFCITMVDSKILMNVSMECIKGSIEISQIVIPELFNETATVLSNDIENLASNWLLVVPYSFFCCKLQYLDKNIELKGQAYHDHNWGNWLIHECYNYWLWGNFQNTNFAITYYYFVGVNGKKIKLLNVVCHGKSINLRNFNIAYLNDQIEIIFYIEQAKYVLTIYHQNEFKNHIRRIKESTLLYSRYASNGKLYNFMNQHIELLKGLNERLRRM